jgi:hypothetical protein
MAETNLGEVKIILEIPAKVGIMAARQSSGVRDSKIHESERW